ncbi:POTRA domain-containing protein [Pendulispora albinea]|uniref:BamA/TamA family outer membrane protein n=1 Tax=Pendulispora albinea TaxID=2741071 RepID=A0ABZ2LZD7_9BACT
MASTCDGGSSSSKRDRPLRVFLLFPLLFVVTLLVSATPAGRLAHAAPPPSAPSGPAPGAKARGEVKVLTPPELPAPPAPMPILPPRVKDDPCVGRPITAIDTELEGEAWGLTKLPKVITVRPGEPFTEAAGRRALSELLERGQFARGHVTGKADGAGCRMVVEVAVRKIIETLRFHMGGVKVDRDELLREADLVEGGEFVGADLADKQERMEIALARHGYPRATIALETASTDDPMRIGVVLSIRDGEPRIVARRFFYVYDAVPEDLASTNDTYRVKAGDRADETSLEAADSQLEARLRARGYHQADVWHDVVESDGRIVLRVRVQAGKLFLPRFEGNDHYDQDALTAALEIEKEADLSPIHLVEKIREFYQKRGYYDVAVVSEERGGPSDRVHHIVFKITEGSRVAVVARTYPCLREDDVRKLTEGGPTSVSDIGREIDSFLEEELPGADIIKSPDPRGVDALMGPKAGRGTRDVPVDLEPDGTYVADTYGRAVEHVQELYRHEGFLHAQAGPVQIVRRACDRKSLASRCIPVPLPAPPPDICTYDVTNLPLPVAPLPSNLTCVPDPAHGVRCEDRMILRIPVKLGPRTTLYDLAFSGARAISERTLARAAALELGVPANTIQLEEARRKLLDVYREEGYAFVDVKYNLEESLDHTRARVRFEITEGEQVIVRQIVLQGNELTREGVIRRRIALELGQPYRASLIRKTQERIATLNVFSSVEVALADPYVPAKNKTVVITLAEAVPKFVEVRPGFSTGEGFRLTTEIGDRNLFGTAIAVSTRVQVSYLPDALILDDQVKKNFQGLERESGAISRVAGRITVRGEFPEMGLGPLVRSGIDGVYSRALQRDFVLTKAAIIPNVTYKPVRQVTILVSPTAEQNDAKVFNVGSLDEYLKNLGARGGDLARILRVPDGTSIAFSQRAIVSWDRRDNSFSAHKGTYFVSGIEHVDWKPVNVKLTCDNPTTCNPEKDARASQDGHFLRFSEVIAGYLPLGKRLTFAAELRLGLNMQLVPNSQTYPDRLFFLGGVESMRGFPQDSLMPQDLADRIEEDQGKPAPPAGEPPRLTAQQIAIRGGNLMINPKFELRIPIKGAIETALFTDVGNLWVDPTYPFEHGFPMRVTVGTGLRFQTPVGPLVFDYGINLTRRKAYEDFGAFHFAIGLF